VTLRNFLTITALYTKALYEIEFLLFFKGLQFENQAFEFNGKIQARFRFPSRYKSDKKETGIY